MKKLISVLAATCMLAALGVTSAIAGGSNGKGGQTITATCTVLGNVTVHASSGQSAWVGNTHYVTVRFTGTFTPTGGQPMTVAESRETSPARSGYVPGVAGDSTGTFTFTAVIPRHRRMTLESMGGRQRT
jgi:hypothetical protein